MRTSLRAAGALAALGLGAAGCSSKAGAPPAPEKLFGVEARSQPGELSAGSRGEVELQLTLAKGAHLSDGAPFKILVSGQGLVPEKDRLGRGDAAHGSKGGPARFEIPFTAQAPGKASLGADLDFYVCTASLCERQQEKVQVAVTVR